MKVVKSVESVEEEFDGEEPDQSGGSVESL